MVRDELFNRCVEWFHASNNNLIYAITMGMGKTRIALEIADGLKTLAILHSDTAIKKTWPDEAKKWGYDISTMVISSFRGIEKHLDSYELVILDEAHLITENISNDLKRLRDINPFVRFVFMTGTMPDDTDRRKLLTKFSKHVMEYSFFEALCDGNANNIEIKIVRIEMDNEEKLPFGKHLRTEEDQYLHICKNLMFAKTQKLKELWINQRMWFIYKSRSKCKAMRYIHDNLKQKGKRHLLFSSTKAIAEELSEFVYHSDTKDTFLTQFQNEEISYLSSVNGLKIGANIPNLRTGVALQINGKTHGFEQILGRFTRDGENKEISQLYCIVLKNTMDETWINNATKNIHPKYIKTFNLNKTAYNHYTWPLELES